MENNLDDTIKKLAKTEEFYSHVLMFLSAVKLVYGGAGLQTYFAKHKNIKKFLLEKIHDDSLNIDYMFQSLQDD